MYSLPPDLYCTCIFFLLIHFTPDTSVLLASGDYLLIDCGQFTPRFVLLQLHFHLTFAFVLTNINSGRKFFFSFYSSLHHQPSLCICILRRDIFRWGSSRQLFMPNDVAILRGVNFGAANHVEILYIRILCIIYTSFGRENRLGKNTCCNKIKKNAQYYIRIHLPEFNSTFPKFAYFIPTDCPLSFGPQVVE